MELITIEEAMGMSEANLQMEIGKCDQYLEKQFGMGHAAACTFVARVLNLGAAAHEKNKTKKESK